MRQLRHAVPHHQSAHDTAGCSRSRCWSVTRCGPPRLLVAVTEPCCAPTPRSARPRGSATADGAALLPILTPRPEVPRAARWRMKRSKDVELFSPRGSGQQGQMRPPSPTSPASRHRPVGVNTGLAFTSDLVRLYFREPLTRRLVEHLTHEYGRASTRSELVVWRVLILRGSSNGGTLTSATLSWQPMTCSHPQHGVWKQTMSLFRI
jgi:hypothetical protein